MCTNKSYKKTEKITSFAFYFRFRLLAYDIVCESNHFNNQTNESLRSMKPSISKRNKQVSVLIPSLLSAVPMVTIITRQSVFLQFMVGNVQHTTFAQLCVDTECHWSWSAQSISFLAFNSQYIPQIYCFCVCVIEIYKCAASKSKANTMQQPNNGCVHFMLTVTACNNNDYVRNYMQYEQRNKNLFSLAKNFFIIFVGYLWLAFSCSAIGYENCTRAYS